MNLKKYRLHSTRSLQVSNPNMEAYTYQKLVLKNEGETHESIRRFWIRLSGTKMSDSISILSPQPSPMEVAPSLFLFLSINRDLAFFLCILLNSKNSSFTVFFESVSE